MKMLFYLQGWALSLKLLDNLFHNLPWLFVSRVFATSCDITTTQNDKLMFQETFNYPR